VTWKHKKRLGIKTIAAPDTPADVIEAAKARRRQRDQKYRHDQRRRLGMKPQAQSASQTKPWEAVGRPAALGIGAASRHRKLVAQLCRR
jgi:hypothetical protein